MTREIDAAAAHDQLPVSDVASRLINEHSAPASDADIHVRLAESIRDAHARHARSSGRLLDELAVGGLEFVSGAQYAGITVADGRGGADAANTVGRYPGLLDAIQRRYQEGPYLDAVRDRDTIRVDDLTTDTRWPNFQREALAQTPIRSALTYPLVVERQLLGALTFYAEQPHSLDADAERVGLVYAAHAALAWNAVRRESQLREALASRDIIGQAKGMLMERHQISADEAFSLLRRLSQQSNTRVAEIARRFVDAAPPNRQ
ncbi:GAF and ANTAR domain-containing protein [Mycobacterium sp. ACS1612]|uniref:GAF and ANTAR domain-containing protein n=1 Tax=Mycobacterium sp. ACS1612 TaxID=1834117 RepID=UPI0018D3AB40|nr:GAF and ANTAR domain-containing protein [Mycobacterium sp. ACS1612]